MYERGSAGERRSIRRRISRIAVAVASVCVMGVGAAVATAVPAGADLFPTCRDQETSTPFALWGDENPYFVTRGGTFESGAVGWNLEDGATRRADNESYFVNSPTDTQSLSLRGDEQATSPRICVDLGDHTVRMFVKSTGDADSTLHIDASVEDPLTGLVFSLGYDINGTGTSEWTPTQQIVIPNLLGGLLETGRLSLRFTTTGTPATWNIDDVYVDPFKSH